ncbi:MAG: RDD family protein [Acidobacteria bacterium]|nr:RDD family protein [Acidobacteriota bacterium]
MKKKLLEVQQKRGRARPGPLPAEQQPSLLPKAPPSPRVPEIRRSAIDPQPAARSGHDIPKSLRDFQAAIQSTLPERRSQPAVHVWKQPVAEKRSARSDPAGSPEPGAVVPESGTTEPESQDWVVRKSILLTRTLSGLIDLLIVAGCSAFFLWVSVRCGDIDILSPSFRPVIWGAAFLFQISYSLFFLALTGRTAGMMLTGLKVVHEQSQQARFHQLLLRTLLFFLSWSTLMLGLLWGLWDRRSRCMHDCFSHTMVVRC